MDNSPGKILGIGGVFFKSPNKEATEAWYRDRLGMPLTQYGAMLSWRAHDQPDQEHMTVWNVFSADTKHFGEGNQTFMINYIVDDLDALIAKLETSGVRIDPKREAADYGKFAWIYDPDGNKVELWQPM